MGLADDARRFARRFARPRDAMSLGCPVPVSVWQEQKGEWISQIPPPSQGANVLGVQQMEPDGSPAPCPGKVGGDALGVGVGGQLEGK